MPDTTTERPMTKEESYIQRRQLFKNIWETAMTIGNEDIMNKPKVIKTLRMDEIDKCPIGKSKKQRIKNLRHVCNRILDFCDRQDADDRFYEKIAHDSHLGKTSSNKALKHRKVKRILKRKIKKAKSMFVTHATVARVRLPTREGVDGGPVRNLSSPVKRKTHYVKSTVIKRKYVKVRRSNGDKKSPQQSKTDDFPSEDPSVNRKEEKKKQGIKKKKHKIIIKPGPPNIISV